LSWRKTAWVSFIFYAFRVVTHEDGVHNLGGVGEVSTARALQ
jgi:hypothetical protein